MREKKVNHPKKLMKNGLSGSEEIDLLYSGRCLEPLNKATGRTGMRVEFIVKGRPPKKHGEKSMWARDDEAPFVVSLREKALEARSKVGLDDCFRSLVDLELTVFAPRSRLESVGDLDNFITGVCDGLQAADSKVLHNLHKIFQEPRREKIDPRHAILIDNDAKVVSITARNIALDEDQEMCYKVVVKPTQTAIASNSG